MGWERKRGKLAEFNRFVRGARRGRVLASSVGDVAPLRAASATSSRSTPTPSCPRTRRRCWSARWPIRSTAPSTTRCAAGGRAGYGILQPRVGVSLPSAHRSPLRRDPLRPPRRRPLHHRGLRRVPGPLRRGQLHRQGHLRRRRFERATHGRFPENTLLSHDLIEGSYARAGLATDITVYDDYPARYLTFTRRKHRWIRGDWQLLPWLRRACPGPTGRSRTGCRCSRAGRSSTTSAAAPSSSPSSPSWSPAGPFSPARRSRWTAARPRAPSPPRGSSRSCWRCSARRSTRSWRAYYAAVGQDAVTSAQQVALAIVFLPHQAWVSADAIVRTLWRLFVSRRQLLEWQTASQAERVAGRIGAATSGARCGRPCARRRGAPRLAGVRSSMARAWHGRPSTGLAARRLRCCRSPLLWVLAPWLAARAQRARGAPRAPAAPARAPAGAFATRCCTGASSIAS